MWEVRSEHTGSERVYFILIRKLLEVDRISWANVTFSPELFFSFTGTEYKKGQQSFTNFRSRMWVTKEGMEPNV